MMQLINIANEQCHVSPAHISLNLILYNFIYYIDSYAYGTSIKTILLQR